MSKAMRFPVLSLQRTAAPQPERLLGYSRGQVPACRDDAHGHSRFGISTL
jgi:hypothetical protein